MKRVLSLILALSMIMSMFTFSFAGSNLKDIEGTEYESAVEALIELGIVTGYPDGTYLPNKTVSRAEMAKLLVIAAGLEPAAEVAVGTTKFSDVSADHWACGYINVASEYGYIAGYPDGAFKPDAEVKYSEAVTMALRVLGYRTVIEAKGTWPTNYIAKAQDLEMLDGITYGKYTDGAIRGNVAMLVWNMLKTRMWDVKSESEGDGLNYTTADPMLNVKFPDYSYSKAIFGSFTRTDDAEIMVSFLTGDELDAIDDDLVVSLEEDEYEYLGNDFYTFVYGTEVEVLVNEEDGILLTMVPTGKDKLVEGSKLDIDDDYEDLEDVVYDYAYARVKSKEIKAETLLEVESEYVYKIEDTAKKYVKINDEKYYYEEEEKEVYIINGERGTVEDIEVGDVLSRVTVAQEDAPAQSFYIVEGSSVEGKLTKVIVEEYDLPADATYTYATIGGEEYTLTDTKVNGTEKVVATYKEDPEDADTDPEVFNAWEKAMNGEEVEAHLDFIGELVAVLFDGEINAGDDSDEVSVVFYGLTGGVERDGSTYTIPVLNEDGEDELTFASKTLGNDYWKDGEDLAGFFTVALINDDGELEAFEDINEYGDFWIDADTTLRSDITDRIVYGEEADEYYDIYGMVKGSYDDDNSAIACDSENCCGKSFKVNNSTVLVTLIFDDKGTERDTDDEYRVEFSTGLDEIEKVKSEQVVVITDAANKFARAKYVVIFDETANREDDLMGIVKLLTKNEIGEIIMTLVEDKDDDARNGEELILSDDNTLTAADLKANYQFVVYSKEENKDGEFEATVVTGLTNKELHLDTEAHAYIAKSADSKNKNVSDDGREIYLANIDAVNAELGTSFTNPIRLDDEEIKDVFGEYRVALINVTENDDNEKQYDVDNYEEISYAEIKLKELDRITIDMDNEFIGIIRGMTDNIAIAAAEEAAEDEAVEEIATNAKELSYTDYTYAGTIDVDGDTVTISMDATTADEMSGAVKKVTADMARFLGALYRTNGVTSIEYDGTEYSWNTEGTLKGSNWEDSEGTTLVSVLKTAYDNEITSFELIIDDGASMFLELDVQ